MAQNVEKLLQEIQQAVSCPYLSDLHSQNTLIHKEGLALIMAIPDDRYTLEDWNTAISYIGRVATNVRSVGEAKAFFNQVK